MVEIDLLSKLELTPNQFYISLSIYKEDEESYLKLIKLVGQVEVLLALDRLKHLRFIHNGNDEGELDFSLLTIRHSFIEAVEIEDDVTWIQFKLAYPRKEGVRPLHNDQENCKKKYIKLIKGNRQLHEQILKAIQSEIDDRRIASYKREFRPAWKLMTSYINQKGWEMYLENKNSEGENDNGARITRSL